MTYPLYIGADYTIVIQDRRCIDYPNVSFSLLLRRVSQNSGGKLSLLTRYIDPRSVHCICHIIGFILHVWLQIKSVVLWNKQFLLLQRNILWPRMSKRNCTSHMVNHRQTIFGYLLHGVLLPYNTMWVIDFYRSFNSMIGHVRPISSISANLIWHMSNIPAVQI